MNANVPGQDHATDAHDHVVEGLGHGPVVVNALVPEIGGPGTEDPGPNQDLGIENQG